MGTNYSKGRMYEYKAIEELKKQGYYCVRAAQSRGVADIVCWDINHFRLIQVKSVKNLHSNWTKKWDEVKGLVELPAPVNCRKELWVWNRAKMEWKKEVLTE